MDAKEAAKLLREHVEIRRKAGTGNPCLNQAIDAAVAALEANHPAIPSDDYARALLKDVALSDVLSDRAGEMFVSVMIDRDTWDAMHLMCADSIYLEHPRERALSEDAARGNFRAPK